MKTLKATYRDGIFIPDVDCDFPDNTQVELMVNRVCARQAEVIDPESRKEILNTLLKRMRKTASKSPSRSLVTQR